MGSSNDSELIASMADMEVKEDTADSFSEGDLVFAKSIGYIAWPGIIVAKQSHQSMVNFLGSDDTRKIDNAKIWPYNESTKAQYITRQNLEYLEFRDAILIAEKLNLLEVDKENGAYCYRVMSNIYVQEQKEESQEEEAKQWKFSLSQEKSMQSGKEEHAEEEHAEEQLGKEEPGKEAPDQKESGSEAHGENDINTIKYLRILRSSQDSLNINLEIKFIEIVNILRNSLKINQKDYPSALLALQELQEIPLNELQLVRNLEAVNSIYVICFLDTAHRNYDEATQVKLLARQFITKIASTLEMPDALGNFMDHFGSLSAIYRRNIQKFERTQRESSKEEYCHEFVAVEEDGQESLAEEEDGQEAVVVKLDRQESLAVELDRQESLGVELNGHESLAMEKDGPNDFDVEEDEEEAMFSLDHYFPTSDIEDRFDQLINILRRSLSFRQKDYPSALLAFDELLSFTFTKNFLMPKYKAVYFIYYLARSGCVFPSNDLAKATLVRNLANQLMVRFFSVFNLPGISAYDFMVHFCSLYSEDIPFEWDSD